MTKRSKLRETESRVPDPRPARWAEALRKYRQAVPRLQSESARSHRFAMLLQELLGFQPEFIEQYSAGVENYLRTRQCDRLVRDRPGRQRDALSA